MTHSGAHETKVKAVLDTWGKHCDKLVITSNLTDPSIGAIRLQTPSTYENLWNKLNETLHYVWNQYSEDDDYEWFFKVDDDSFVIMENLEVFLSSPEIDPEEPTAFGYLLSDETWGEMRPYFFTPENQAFGNFFYTHIRNNMDDVDYLAGGAGYVMNRAYLQEFLKALDSNLTLRGMPPEDMAHGATMLARGIRPQNSRDTLGRERFLPDTPELVELRHAMRLRRGVALAGSKCCSRYSITFHHIPPWQMRYLYDQLYTCRGRPQGQN
jgi:glycoprotein-N-acetylgalactosamine 3-beta-galactosyltransferase